MNVKLDLSTVEGYRLFLRIKDLPTYHFTGRVASFPDEYGKLLGLKQPSTRGAAYKPSQFLFDYQRDVSALAIRKQKFAVFMDCGWGKTLIMLEYVRAVSQSMPANEKILIVSPLMVVKQTLKETAKFYGGNLHVHQVRAADLPGWMHDEKAPRIGITNYEAITDRVDQGLLGCLILDESSMLKSHYGKWGQRLIGMGRGLDWKLCLTGTPAPNDRIEYANHAVFLDHYPTVNSFLARYFVNRGQTNERWELKPHALRPFYRDLSHWCIFVTNPATYGWKDNVGVIPPIHVHIHDVDMTREQKDAVMAVTGDLVATPGGIVSRSKLSQLAKGKSKTGRVDTNKPGFIRDLVASWPDESTIVWCKYNDEQDTMEEAFPGAASIRGATKESVREQMLNEFQSGDRRVLISKPEVMGFGLNLQIATRQVFSGLEDSFEDYYQAVKRSNRVGSDRPLNVHIPVTEIERPMIDTVLRKAKRVQQDAEEQESLFKEIGHVN